MIREFGPFGTLRRKRDRRRARRLIWSRPRCYGADERGGGTGRKISPPKRAIDLVVRNRRAAHIEITGFEIAYPVVKGREQPRAGKRRFPVQITAAVGQIVYAHLDILPPIPYGGLVRGGRNRPPCAGLWLHEPARLAVLRPSLEIRFSRDQSIDERRLHLIAPCLGLDRGPDLVPGGLHAIANHPLATTTSEKTTEQQHIKSRLTRPRMAEFEGQASGNPVNSRVDSIHRFYPAGLLTPATASAPAGGTGGLTPGGRATAPEIRSPHSVRQIQDCCSKRSGPAPIAQRSARSRGRSRDQALRG